MHTLWVFCIYTLYASGFFNENVKMVDKVRKQIAAEITQKPSNTIYSERYFALEHVCKLPPLSPFSFHG